jgi:hypothetical protein
MSQKPLKGDKISSNSQANFNLGSNNPKRTSSRSHPKKVSHHKSPELMNITNGMQKLQLESKQYPHSHSSKLDFNDSKNISFKPHQSKIDNFGKNGLYAGAGFDRSPEASSLPIPKFTKKANLSSFQNFSSAKTINVEDLFRTAEESSSKVCIHPDSSNRDNYIRNDTETLRRKSQTLMKILDASCSTQGLKSSPVITEKGPLPPTEDLEEMTAQVRRLLNL